MSEKSYIWRKEKVSNKRVSNMMNRNVPEGGALLGGDVLMGVKKFSTKEKAFDVFRDFIMGDASQLAASEYTLVEIKESGGQMEVNDLDMSFLDMCDCSDCTYGRVRAGSCDMCGE